MAKSDSFFIRAEVTTSGTDYKQTEIDLGSFVNLGVSKSTLLRIHNVAISMADDTDPASQAPFLVAANSETLISTQLCTQSQTAPVHASDKSLISSGKVFIGNDTATALNASQITQAFDVLPQQWTNGYLVGVDSLFWGAEANIALNGEVTCSIVMECTLEPATQANSVALALSQQ
ncbi:MAG: hypothetical protein [Circular genetic element sp.]|nr:MAG: hypothetical protein [Circular genetic element sp.]